MVFSETVFSIHIDRLLVVTLAIFCPCLRTRIIMCFVVPYDTVVSQPLAVLGDNGHWLPNLLFTVNWCPE